MKGRVTRLRPSTFWMLWWMLCAALAGGCAKGAKEAKGNEAAQRRTVASAPPSVPDATLAAQDPDELERAFAASRRALGAGRLHAKSKVSVAGVQADGSDAPDELYEDALVERAANGDLHARYENSRDQAREIVASGGQVWLRPGFGKFHRRAAVDPAEAERAANDMSGVLAADFDLVAAQAAVSDGGAAKVGGRTARRVVLALGPARARAAQAHTGTRAWRDGANVEALSGEVFVDDATGAVLGGRLEARVGFMQNGHRKVMALSASEEMADLAGAVAVAAPDEADSVTSPGRSTDFEDREELLSGLAPPARRGGAVKP